MKKLYDCGLGAQGLVGRAPQPSLRSRGLVLLTALFLATASSEVCVRPEAGAQREKPISSARGAL